ncbi:NAD(P)-binding domain-containing protein [Nocardiopsis alba]|uniref:Putative 4-hydroxy-4-methyl-2-oxoglutarate aldolase n=1 Tax=Nocardiopsis alba (strain ATCC BAA-2165 / BE74) TaxID=1205910 RepID=J7KXZ2_NOCAA|nr:NAD(P)-binding domain-containing protein [Nocardiopsis alba]AFR06268.1 NAD binding domain of 6-phosphogluconate dehydrogenase family protein [Nocardiopsis alba ATCC BAA-2165]
MMKVAVLGLGEAGAIFAEAYAAAGQLVIGFDPASTVRTPEGVDRASSTAEAVAGADVVLSLATAAHAVSVAREAASALRSDAVYIDLNAASPQVKTDVARTVDGAARVVDGALIGSVVKFGSKVDILLAGPAAEEAARMLQVVGANAEPIGETVGAASGRKLLRSVFMKGLGALITEALDAGRAAGEEEWMREQVAAALTDGTAALERLDNGTRLHAVRRSQELDASIALLDELRVEAPVSTGAADRHRYLARVTDHPDERLIDAYATIPTAAIGDARDRLGFLSSRIRPVWAGARLSGRALTVRTRPGDNRALHEALTVARPGDVLVVDGGGDDSRALLGELIAERAINKGVRGMVIDGAVRDADELRELGFPVWSAAISPAGPYKDGPGHIGRTIAVGGAVCSPGDIVVADGDGVFVVPRLEAERTLVAARLVLADEAERREAIRRERA